jgi:uncharacterized protein DUF3131
MLAFAVSNRYLNCRAAENIPARLSELARQQHPQPPDRQDKLAARCAWAYFKRHTNPVSGFANGEYGRTGLRTSDLGASLIAIVAAESLSVIAASEAEARLSACLENLAGMELNDLGLPGLWCQNTALGLANGAGRLASPSDGWSAPDILRLVAGFIITAHHFPAFAPEIWLILNRWRLDRLAPAGRFVSSPQTTLSPATGFYASRVADMIGLTTATDRRETAAPNADSDIFPVLLEALEFGWRPEALEFANRCYLDQKSRFETTGCLGSPGRWGAAGQGEETLSTASVFAWAVLLPTPYSQKLRDAVEDLQTPNGWIDGRQGAGSRRDKRLSLATNAAVLEALHLKAVGPLFN